MVAGLLLGGFYAAVTLGVSVIFGLLDIANIAQPAFVLLGAYAAYAANAAVGLDPILTGLLLTPVFYGVGAVVMHFGLAPDGAVHSRTIAASIPAGPLADAVEKTLGQWRIEKSPGSAPDCRMPSSFHYSVRFVLR